MNTIRSEAIFSPLALQMFDEMLCSFATEEAPMDELSQAVRMQLTQVCLPILIQIQI